MLSAIRPTNKPSFLALFALLFLFSAQANALPLLQVRQAPGSQTSLTTTKETVTPAGTLVETCEIILTPIKDATGNDAFEKVTKCTVQVRAGDNPGAPPISSTSGATTETTVPSATVSSSVASEATASASPAITILPEPGSSAITISGAPPQSSSEPAASSSVDSASASATASESASDSAAPTPSATDSAASSSATESAAPSSSAVIQLTPAVPSATDSAAVSSSASAAPSASSSAEASASSEAASSAATSAAASSSAAAPAEPTPSTTLSVDTPQATPPPADQPPAADNRGTDPSATATDAADGTAAASESSGASEPFALPGKKISVLPIGLGVFAGISVIALIVVGLVTYERTKYRKQFRKQKLAETAAPMGYGGGGYNSV